MSLTKDFIKTRYPLPSYNYKVSIDQEFISFSQVSGLSLSYETSTYKESPTSEPMAGPITMKMPAQKSDITITMQKGVIRGGVSINLFKWISSTQTNLIEKKDINIDLCDEEGNPVFRWTVINAFPTSLEAPTFDAASNDAAIESMTLMADDLIVEEL